MQIEKCLQRNRNMCVVQFALFILLLLLLIKKKTKELSLLIVCQIYFDVSFKHVLNSKLQARLKIVFNQE